MKWLARVIDTVTFGSVAAIGLLMVPSAYDPFRHPKLLLLHAAGITLIGLMSAAVIADAIPRRELIRREPAFLLIGAILLWTAITAAASAHVPTAAFAFLTAASAAALFVAAVWSAKRYPVVLLLAVLLPSAINAGLAIVQELKIWNEIAPYELRDVHTGTIGLLGNPNDVGSYLVPGLIVAAAWFLAAKRVAHRLLLAPVVLLILGGIAASRTRGAILGAVVGLAALAIARWRVAGAIRIGALAVIGALGVAFFAPQLFERFSQTPVELLLSGRIIAFAAAWRMFTDSPLLGVGPGCFEYAYFDYASRVYPTVIEYSVAGRQSMFGEAHNDHLQIAAETGLIGWLLFAASLVTVGAASRFKIADDAPVRERFARLCGAALVAALAALALFQFPLYLAAPLSAFVCTAAIVVSWTEDEAVAD